MISRKAEEPEEIACPELIMRLFATAAGCNKVRNKLQGGFVQFLTVLQKLDFKMGQCQLKIRKNSKNNQSPYAAGLLRTNA